MNTGLIKVEKRQLGLGEVASVFSLGLAVTCNIPALSTFLEPECRGYNYIKNAICQTFVNVKAEFLKIARNKLAATIPATISQAPIRLLSFKWGNLNNTQEVSHLLGSYKFLKVDAKIACIGCYVQSNPIITVEVTRDSMEFKPIFNIRKTSITGEISPYIQVGIGLGVELLSGVFKYGIFAGFEAKETMKVTVGLNPNEPCGEDFGLATDDSYHVNIIHKVVLDPISKNMIEKVVGALGYDELNLEGNIKEIYNPKPAQKCHIFTKDPLNIPRRPGAQSTARRIKQQMFTEFRGTSFMLWNKDGPMTKYTFEIFTCKNGEKHLLPYNELTGGALFAWCDGRKEKDPVDEWLECPGRVFQCNGGHITEADRKEEPANQYLGKGDPQFEF
ncbi:hypothetical protein TWF481_010453 [Arthrobotrys musiformis]|uniref:Uncharacterized protein n=1 Tax=Arthrobotrys musiformis TaxID=47236 RepID=A0AAV9W0V0_9PEZI